MLHHIGQQALSWSVSSPEMKGKEIRCDPIAISSHTAKWTPAVRLALWHLRIICRAVKTCWGKRMILETWISCESKAEERVQWGSLSPTLGFTIDFLIRSIGLYLSPYVVDSPQPEWNDNFSKPFTQKRRRGCSSVHWEIRSSDMTWITNRKNDNSYYCLSPKHRLWMASFNPGNNLRRESNSPTL